MPFAPARLNFNAWQQQAAIAIGICQLQDTGAQARQARLPGTARQTVANPTINTGGRPSFVDARCQALSAGHGHATQFSAESPPPGTRAGRQILRGRQLRFGGQLRPASAKCCCMGCTEDSMGWG